MLNALLISDALGYSFKFSWSPGVWNPLYRKSDAEKPELIHSALDFPAEDLFAKEFISSHCVPRQPPGVFHKFRQREATPARIQEWEREADFAGVIPVQLDIRGEVGALSSRKKKPNYAQVFSQISFSPRYEEIKHLAHTIELPENFIAIHLRSGDLVYGEPRKWGLWVKKVTPPSLAKRIIRQTVLSGSPVVIFSQNHEIGMSLAQEGGNCKTIDDILQGVVLTGVERAFAEMLIMSRATAIIGGSSGFARFSSFVGNAQLVSPWNFFPPREVIEVISSDLSEDPSRYDSLTRAKSWWQAYYISKGLLSAKEADYLLDQAIKEDPRNALYSVVLASRLYSRGLTEDGDAVVEGALASEGRDSLDGSEFLETLTYRHPDNDFSCAEYFRGFRNSAGKSEIASRCSSAISDLRN